jgi:Fe-Mn family superoxide dismutase
MFTIKPLPYDYAALEPALDEATMRVHHDKHYQTYCDKFNAALEKFPALASRSVEDLLTDLDNLPAEVKLGVRNMGGGYYNHTLFFDLLSGVGEGGKPSEALLAAIGLTWGGLEQFRTTFTSLATSLFGSGWVMLVKKVDGSLTIENFANQDTPLAAGSKPLLLLDVWEHAYYLKYQNRRADYVTAWWPLVNWRLVSERFES